jgi:hypothetical protein
VIDPDKIPVFTGDLIELRREVISLRRAAKAIREHGGDVHTRFQHLDAFYKAPEAGQLFATTQAVQDTSGDVADKLEKVAGALEDYAVEAADIVRQLEALRAHAAAFVASVHGDSGFLAPWRKDQKKVDEHQALWDGVNAAVAAFQRAEVTCADKITALVGGTQWHINDGSPKQENAYGFSAEQLAQADKLPWGSPEHYEALPGGIDYHLQQMGLSIFDNAKGAVEGLVDLFSPGEKGDATREGLARVAIGAEGYLMDPYGDNNSLDPVHKQLMDESKPYAKEFAKSFVGWDDWQTNPGKAMGTVIFNGLTLGAGPLGAASRAGSAAGEAGAAARVAGTLAKVGEMLDPIGAATKTVGMAARALPKVSDLVSGVRAATEAAATADKAHSFLQLSDGSQLRLDNGQFIPAKHGELITSPPPHEPAAADRGHNVASPGHMTSESSRGATDASAHSDRSHELVGAGARAEHAAGSARTSEQTTGQTGGHVGGHAASREGSSTGSAGAESSGRSGAGSGTGGHGSPATGHGSHGAEPDHGSADHEAADAHEAHESPEDAGSHSSEVHHHGSSDGEPDYRRRALPPGTADRTLHEMRRMRHSRERYKGAEDYVRKIAGGAPERHYRVPTHDHPYHPVQAPGGRNVDVPVDMPGGRTLAVEVKHYLEWRTIKLKDGGTRPVRGEVPLNDGIIEQINKDLTLRRLNPDFDPRWLFLHAPPSQALRNYLIQARIIFVEYGPAPK